VPALFALGIVARLPIGMVPLALLLTARDRGLDYGLAGLIVGAYTVGLAVGSPIAGRRLDRLGPARVLGVRAIVYSVLLAVLAVLLGVGAPSALAAIAASACGATVPPIGSAIRSLWGAVAEGRLLQAAFSLEAALQELYFTVGPLLVAAAAVIDPLAALGVAAAGSLVGTTLLTRLPPVRADQARERTPHPGSLLGALGSPGVRTVVLFSGLCGVGFGAMEVALPAFVEEHGDRALAGIVLACFAAGSMVGGLVAGTRHTADVAGRLRRMGMLLAPAFAVSFAARSIPAMCACIFVAGLPIAPAFAASYGLLDRVAIPGTVSEGFAWNSMAIVTGVSIGTAVAGHLVDAEGPRAAMVLASGAVASAALGLLSRPRSLATPARPAQPR
jgi:MFS family permease